MDLDDHTDSLFRNIVASMPSLSCLSERDFIRSFFVTADGAAELMRR